MLSMGLNIGLVSWIGGKKAAMHPEIRERIQGLREIAKTLPRDQKRNLRQTIRNNREKRQELMQVIKTKREEVNAVLTQETVDKKALKAKLEELRNAQLQMMEMMHETSLTILPEMPLEKRKEFTEKRRGGFR